MRKINLKFYLLIVFLGIVIFPILSFAEDSITVQPSDIQIQIIPENPRPYQNVTIKLISYATDLNKAMISWESGGKTILSGYGKTSYNFTASGPNTITVFAVSITPSGYMTTINKQIAISPAEVGLLWEAVDGYTPPFYKGKALLSRQGIIKVVAIPTTNDIKQGQGKITYTWKVNDQTNQNVSGYNKSSYTFQNNILSKTESVSVTASSVDDSYQATSTINIPTYAPEILFYEESPTLGVLYNHALQDNFKLNKEEETIVAEPYYLTLKNNKFNFTYDWQINGKSVETPTIPTELTIKSTSDSGYAIISLTMENLKTLFQEATGQLKINL